MILKQCTKRLMRDMTSLVLKDKTCSFCLNQQQLLKVHLHSDFGTTESKVAERRNPEDLTIRPVGSIQPILQILLRKKTLQKVHHKMRVEQAPTKTKTKTKKKTRNLHLKSKRTPIVTMLK